MNPRKIHVRFVATVSFLFVSALLLGAQAGWAEYPDRPVNLIVDMAPGGPADLLTRALAIGTEKYLGKPLVLENKAGGGGAAALSLIANAKADGYALCSSGNATIVDTALMQKVMFKPLKSFTPVISFSMAEYTALVVRPDSPFKNFNDFRDYAKKNPGKIKYSSSGVGTGTHIGMAVIVGKDELKVVHLPHQGSAPAMTALLGGHVDA